MVIFSTSTLAARWLPWEAAGLGGKAPGLREQPEGEGEARARRGERGCAADP
jgi:hypothetical protein